MAQPAKSAKSEVERRRAAAERARGMLGRDSSSTSTSSSALKLSEEAVFRWVVIVGIAGASVVALTLLTTQLVGALWALALVGLGVLRAWLYLNRRK